MLLGQMKAVAKKGMFAVFIDLKKAYDRVVDRGKVVAVFGKYGLWWAGYGLFAGSLQEREWRSKGW